MSFDVFLISFREGKNAPANARAARAIFQSSEITTESDKEGGYHYLRFSDGSGVELYAKGLTDDAEFDGGMFALRGFSTAVVSFIFRLAQAAGRAIFASMEGAYVILPSPDLASHLPTEVRSEFTQVVVANGAELEAMLSGGYDAWRAYADQLPGRRSN